jgi:hypothetical protein
VPRRLRLRAETARNAGFWNVRIGPRPSAEQQFSNGGRAAIVPFAPSPPIRLRIAGSGRSPFHCLCVLAIAVAIAFKAANVCCAETGWIASKFFWKIRGAPYDSNSWPPDSQRTALPIKNNTLAARRLALISRTLLLPVRPFSSRSDISPVASPLVSLRVWGSARRRSIRTRAGRHAPPKRASHEKNRWVRQWLRRQ